MFKAEAMMIGVHANSWVEESELVATRFHGRASSYNSEIRVKPEPGFEIAPPGG